jgi:DNA-binding NarL/FixJ family response regulator
MVASAALTSFFSLLLAYLIYRRNVDLAITRAFLYMAIFLSVWAFVAVFAYTTQDVEHFAQLFTFGSVFQMLHFGAFLHLALALTGRVPRKRRYLFLLYLPCALTGFFFLLQEDYALGFELVQGVWKLNHPYDSPAFIGMAIIWFGYYGPAAYLYFTHARKTIVIRERKLYTVLAFSVVALIAAAVLEVLVAPLIFEVPSQGHVITFKFIWLLCLGLVIDRFQFLTAPDNLEGVALHSFPDTVVIVLDRGQRVRDLNERARCLLGGLDAHGEPGDLRQLLPQYEKLHREIAELSETDRNSISCVIEVAHNGSSPTLLDLKVSLLRDRTGGHLGFLLVGVDLPGALDARLTERLSRREIEIVQEIIQGHKTTRIAQRLFISERTVKTHITHIFTKLGIENRLQLYALLKEGNVISRHRTDRNLLLNQRGRSSENR